MDKNISVDILEEAERWHKIFQSGVGSDSERGAFKKWYQANAEHQAAYAQVFSAYDSGYDIDAAAAQYQPVAGTNKARNNTLKDRILAAFKPSQIWRPALVPVMALFLVFIMQPWQVTPEYTIYETAIGQTERVELADGSVLTLGAGSQVRAALSGGDERRVTLEAGEAHFDVAKDPSRPFVVTSGDTQISVLGTVFNVRKTQANLTISLLEGRVLVEQETKNAVLPFLSSTKSVALKPAHTVSVAGGVLERVQPKAIEAMATWMNGQLNYQAVPLQDVVADLNRYSDRPVVLSSSTIAALPVTAVFGVDQIDTMIEGLPHILPVKLTVQGGNYVLSPKRGG